MKPLVNAPLLREHALARGMVAGYVFNEGSGRRINDATGQAPGVFSSAVTKSSVSGWQGSKQGGGLAFNGATEYAQLPEWPFDFERTQPFAFAFRATFANVSEAAHPIWTKNVNGGTFRGVGVLAFNGVSASNAICLQVISTFTSNTLQVVTPAGSIAAGIPYDVVVSYDGSSTPGGCFISINGVPQTLSTTYNSLSATILNDVAPWIGARSDSALPGRVLLDYLYIYRRTIGRAEAKAFRADPYQMFDRSPASGIWVPVGETPIPPPPVETLNLAPGKPRQIRYSARINGELVTGTYEEIQALILRIAEQEAEKAADEAIKEAKKPKRAPFLRILPGKPVEKTEEVQPERIVAKPLVTEYEDAYRKFLDKLISERLAAQIAAEMDDEEALLLLL